MISFRLDSRFFFPLYDFSFILARYEVFHTFFGCQMNAYDARRIADLLKAEGFEETSDAHATDAVIFNTCYIREKAAQKVFSELGRLRDSLSQKPLFAIVGCMARAEGETIFKRAPFVSIVLSSQRYHLLPRLLRKGGREMDIGLSGLEKFGCLPPQTHAKSV